MNKTTKITIVVVLAILLFSTLLWFASNSVEAPKEESDVSNFAECVDAGHTVIKSYPPQCKTPDGRTFIKETSDKNIDSFAECAKYYPVMMSYPRQCKTQDGRTFREETDKNTDETFTTKRCPAATGTDEAALTLEQAKEIAKQSECGDQLTEIHRCNEETGTWWIDLDIQKEGCSPVCVINAETREANINWRCTGLIFPEENTNKPPKNQ